MECQQAIIYPKFGNITIELIILLVFIATVVKFIRKKLGSLIYQEQPKELYSHSQQYIP